MTKRKHGAGPRKFDYNNNNNQNENKEKKWKRYEKFKGGEDE